MLQIIWWKNFKNWSTFAKVSNIKQLSFWNTVYVAYIALCSLSQNCLHHRDARKLVSWRLCETSMACVIATVLHPQWNERSRKWMGEAHINRSFNQFSVCGALTNQRSGRYSDRNWNPAIALQSVTMVLKHDGLTLTLSPIFHSYRPHAPCSTTHREESLPPSVCISWLLITSGMH